ncbi:MAG: PEGA domain-containing protein [Acidobacteria bacterium]|nr:PEGA domain-containing protein [Acidobacteriota bacterium]
MSTPAAPATARANVSFRDGLGERTPIVESSSGDTLEALWLAKDLAAKPAFERSLRERVGRLIEFRHPSYARIWRVEGEAGAPGGLALVAERPRGVRLADMLTGIEEGRVAHDLQVARSLIEQLVSAIASLHLVGRDVAHGAIGPERLIVTPHARLVIVEHVFGPALEQLELTRTRLWRDYRVAIPSAAGISRLDQRADALQIGVVALSLMLGRPLREDEFPGRLRELVDEVCQAGGTDRRPPHARAFGVWLIRALQLDLRHSFQSAGEAQASLDGVVQDEPRPGAVRLAPAPPRARTGVAGHARPAPGAGHVWATFEDRDEEPALLAGLEPGSFAAGRHIAAWLTQARAAGRVALRAVAILTAVAAMIGLADIALDRYAGHLLPSRQPTVVTIGSPFAGAEVIVDGKSLGRAPTDVAIPPGPHTIEVRPVAKAKTPQPPTTSAAPARTTARR